MVVDSSGEVVGAEHSGSIGQPGRIVGIVSVAAGLPMFLSDRQTCWRVDANHSRCSHEKAVPLGKMKN